MLRTHELQEEAKRLRREVEDLEAKLLAADINVHQLAAARRALIEPREKAADLLRKAANALCSIPPLGLDVG